MKTGLLSRFLGALALAGSFAAPVNANDLENSFDQLLGTDLRAPQLRPVVPVLPGPTSYNSSFEAQLAALASPQMGRIGVSAVDLATGRNVQVLGSQPFPLASTSKIAIVATFLQGVDEGRYRLSDQFPLMVPVPSPKFSTTIAPVRRGTMLSAQSLIELAITRSDNQATDALLAAVGGTSAVNRWIRMAGVSGFRLDRDIATLVRDDGAINPATTVDPRDSTTPLAMTRLLTGLYRGEWLSPSSRAVLLGAMERCQTGKRRMRALLPDGAQVAHKTGTLSNTSSDVGIIRTPDGHAYAVAIYVTGQSGKSDRDSRIASIARAIYDGYQTESSSVRRTASR
ncbi:MAG TPA: serine hydrolase [Novosphingobium sp.]|nr:serine hydrolase [Novosphingobium sp.]